MPLLSLAVSNPQLNDDMVTQVLTERGSVEDLLKLHQAYPERYPYLLESVAQTDAHRYSILFAFPQQTHTLNDFSAADDFQKQFAVDFFSQKTQSCKTDLPFSGGWFVYLSYEYGQVIEPVLDLPQGDLPLAVISRIPAALIIDHQTQQLTAVAEQADLLAEMVQDWQAIKENALATQAIQLKRQTEEPEAKFLQGVHRIKEYILAGDVFQVNLSRQWTVELAENVDSLSVYQALRQHNPAPFAALAQFDGWSVISSSPERMVRVRPQDTAMQVETRPIAGTRRREKTQAEDEALKNELIAHPKERAEHIMLIDLERNDLGRICQPGSVQVNELMTVESYEHVHHIVSNVQGHLSEDFNPLEVLHAVFPGGTITGCPKIRCMEIIAELEQMPRLAYTGSLGYINRDGSMDTNILIRSFVHRQTENQLLFRAGAGIVADSIAEKELEETRHKARGLLRALGAMEK